MPRAWHGYVAARLYFEHERCIRRERLLERRAQIVGLDDLRALDAKRLGEKREVRVVRPAVRRREFGAVAVLEVRRPDGANRREAEIVEDDPEDGHAELDSRGERADGREQAAVANQAD